MVFNAKIIEKFHKGRFRHVTVYDSSETGIRYNEFPKSFGLNPVFRVSDIADDFRMREGAFGFLWNFTSLRNNRRLLRKFQFLVAQRLPSSSSEAGETLSPLAILWMLRRVTF